MTEKFDALVPPEMAQVAEQVGVNKANMPKVKKFSLAVLAGVFIAMGAIFATTIATGSGDLPFGVSKLLTGLVFCLGLVLVIVGGAELFTGNNLIVMAWASRKVTTRSLISSWAIVYLGNFVGSLLIALLMFFTRQYTFGGGEVGEVALKIAVAKTELDFVQAVALGLMCNAMVCLAVWLSYSAHSTTDKILSIIFPITGFVAAGFEHCVANMYFIPIGLFINAFDPAFVASTGLNVTNLNWTNFMVNNLLPVTIGNIIGGTLIVGAVYWYVYLLPQRRATSIIAASTKAGLD